MSLPVCKEKEDEEARDQRKYLSTMWLLVGGTNRQGAVSMPLSAGAGVVTS